MTAPHQVDTIEILENAYYAWLEDLPYVNSLTDEEQKGGYNFQSLREINPELQSVAIQLAKSGLPDAVRFLETAWTRVEKYAKMLDEHVSKLDFNHFLYSTGEPQLHSQITMWKTGEDVTNEMLLAESLTKMQEIPARSVEREDVLRRWNLAAKWLAMQLMLRGKSETEAKGSLYRFTGGSNALRSGEKVKIQKYALVSAFGFQALGIDWLEDQSGADPEDRDALWNVLRGLKGWSPLKPAQNIDDNRWPNQRIAAMILDLNAGTINRYIQSNPPKLRTNGKTGKQCRIDPVDIVDFLVKKRTEERGGDGGWANGE